MSDRVPLGAECRHDPLALYDELRSILKAAWFDSSSRAVRLVNEAQWDMNVVRAERDDAIAKCEVLASWLETVLWHVNNPNRAGEGMNIGDATRALHDFSPEAAHRVNPGLASLYDKVKAS